MIKAILFDFFGVIRQDSFQAWMLNHGYTRSDEPGDISRRMDLGLISNEQFCSELASLSGQTIDELMSEFEQNEKFDQDMIDYIVVLKTTYKIGLLSNSESDYLRKILSEKNLERLFDAIVISGEVGYAKPDTELFKTALDMLGVQSDESIFIDDQQKNIDAAEKIGIRGIKFEDFDKFKEELEVVLE